MTVMAPAALAAFLYLPPGETSAVVPQTAGSDIGSTAAGHPEGRTVEDGVTVSPLQVPVTTAEARQAEPANGAAEAMAQAIGLWRVHADETLRDVLDRWGGRAGVEVLFLTDRRYRLHEARAFEGTFIEATQALLAALDHLPHAPVDELRPGGRTLAVLHRMRMVGERQ